MTQPLLLGYVRADALGTAEELAAATHSLAAFASAEGFDLGQVYTERDAAQSVAFHALLTEVQRVHPQAVVVPTLQHLGAADRPAMRADLESHQARVMVVDQR